MQIKFVKSAVLPTDYPPAKRLEIAITGRSNAGKSSFINSLGKNKVAKVSSTPGKTRLLNFFEVGDHYTLVDMPGYGFASRSGSEMFDWKKMVEDYLLNRENLGGLLLVMDIRRHWEEDEDLLLNFARDVGFPIAVILTKADKIKKAEVSKAVARIRDESSIYDVFAISSLTKAGTSVLEQFIFESWVRPAIERS